MNLEIARGLVQQMIAERNGQPAPGRRVKQMRVLKRDITAALGLDYWPGFGPAKVMVGLADYCSPAEAGVAFHVAGGDADAFHFAQIADQLS